MEPERRRSRWAAIGRGLLSVARALAPPVPSEDHIGLERCPDCKRDRVSPVEWEPEDDERWALTLRCGECGAWRDVVASNARVSLYEVALDRHQRAIERAVAKLDAERMAAELELFVRALSEDLIDATDFAG